MIKKLANYIIRPQRTLYDVEEELGDQIFQLDQNKFWREDLQIKNNREQTIEVSMFMPMNRNKKKYDCIIYCHGNSGNKCSILECLDHILLNGLIAVSFDFSGCGKSDGDFVSLGYFEQDDLSCVAQEIQKYEYIRKIGVWGRSMGAATTLLYASQKNSLASVICCDSAFACLKQLIYQFIDKFKIIGNFLADTIFQNVQEYIQKIFKFDLNSVDILKLCKTIDIPGVFIHALDDSIIHFSHTDEIVGQFQGRKQFFTVKGEHNDIRPRQLYQLVIKFFLKNFQEIQQEIQQKEDEQQQNKSNSITSISSNPYQENHINQKQQSMQAIGDSSIKSLDSSSFSKISSQSSQSGDKSPQGNQVINEFQKNTSFSYFNNNDIAKYPDNNTSKDHNSDQIIVGTPINFQRKMVNKDNKKKNSPYSISQKRNNVRSKQQSTFIKLSPHEQLMYEQVENELQKEELNLNIIDLNENDHKQQDSNNNFLNIKIGIKDNNLNNQLLIQNQRKKSFTAKMITNNHKKLSFIQNNTPVKCKQDNGKYYIQSDLCEENIQKKQSNNYEIQYQQQIQSKNNPQINTIKFNKQMRGKSSSADILDQNLQELSNQYDILQKEEQDQFQNIPEENDFESQNQNKHMQDNNNFQSICQKNGDSKTKKGNVSIKKQHLDLRQKLQKDFEQQNGFLLKAKRIHHDFTICFSDDGDNFNLEFDEKMHSEEQIATKDSIKFKQIQGIQMGLKLSEKKKKSQQFLNQQQLIKKMNSYDDHNIVENSKQQQQKLHQQ